MKKRTGQAQTLAKKRVLDYVSRLGLGAAARRLGTSVKTVEEWLKAGFPKEVVPDALAFAGSGGLYVAVRRTRSKDLAKKLGKRAALKLLGISRREFDRRIERNRPVKFRRPQLAKLVEKRGLKNTAKLLGTTARSVDVARKPVQTAATGRLRGLIKELKNGGEEKVARSKAAKFLGIPESRLDKWLEWNVPRAWEKAVSRKIGREKWEKPAREEIERARRPTKREIERAKITARAWNSRVGPGFRISLAEAERQARLGGWDAHLALAKYALAQSKKKRAPRGFKKVPPPPLPPRRGPRPVIPRAEPKPRTRPPSRIKELPAELATPEALNDFQQLRASAFFEGTAQEVVKRHKNTPYNIIGRTGATGVQGFFQYGKVENFAHLVDLDALARKIIGRARSLWKKVRKGQGTMTIRFTFAAQGKGNPFYVDAWVPDPNQMTFIRNGTGRIDEARQISEEVYGLINQIYEVGSSMLLFIEHYEVARSS